MERARAVEPIFVRVLSFALAFLFLVTVTVGLSYVVLTTLPIALRAARR